MAWIFLIIAGLLEMIGIVFMNIYAQHRKKMAILGVAFTFMLSLTTLSIALQSIPMSTGYAVWTGIGAVGGTLVSIVFYGESKHALRLLCIAVILGCTIGLKLMH
ncbi:MULTISPECIES: multidrug efflux SMR transporter [Staphylococcus]|uniref:QacE family quaternary ammonium compound efflux SMR transporter n=1 Tax=Staphylococcus agnetis TaxID=985762 RepID=A0A2T4MHH5_9STAP|nr:MULTISPECIES: multidrug efflux SMR transporter [Staphylococcus]NHM92729.1 multidrug efflux SMR transporter [Staphylococcus sp. 10602379]NJI02187.1 QacE family quaternary ammonium compound efflux SMR transporter [Staphylococcus agnetis]NJI13091.1 QacE family quaternary ammonium compound efflux SMR transporter [Staphylococcus agnetis]OSP22161.1 QacE family quaternary ammonium compound efflux SMR transporter [Staphylococcus agnetis]OSP23798.1 QacE family quaternary ammonium compound efflux SMR